MTTLKQLQNLNIDKIVNSVIADDPDAIIIASDLADALAEVKAGKYTRTTNIEISPIVKVRHQLGLSQSQFAKTIGISVNTLRSWEQGERNPSGSAKVLLNLLCKKPELIAELA